ncbi:MAG: MarR family winged helix-turn-helix transcriptional regulator [Enterococcus sp.]
MDNLAYLFIKSSRLLKGVLDKRLASYHVTAAQFSVLNQIAMQNGQVTLVQIAEKLGSDRPTISVIINRLERNGLIEKIAHPQDKRSAFLKIKAEHLAFVAELRVVSEQVNQEIFSGLTASESKQLASVLQTLIQTVDDLG